MYAETSKGSIGGNRWRAAYRENFQQCVKGILKNNYSKSLLPGLVRVTQYPYRKGTPLVGISQHTSAIWHYACVIVYVGTAYIGVGFRSVLRHTTGGPPAGGLLPGIRCPRPMVIRTVRTRYTRTALLMTTHRRVIISRGVWSSPIGFPRGRGDVHSSP